MFPHATPGVTLCDLAAQRCNPCHGGEPAIGGARATELLKLLPGWEQVGAEIVRTYSFKDYYRTISFVNAIAWIAHQEDHHPDLEVGYDKCRVRYSTHSVGGLSENDFICAAKVEAVFGNTPGK